MTIPLGPLYIVAGLIMGPVPPIISATHPSGVPPPGTVQSRFRPKKKKSVPELPPTLGLKNSVQPEHWAAVEVRSCCENEKGVFMMRSLNPNTYCHGVVSAVPVPQTLTIPVEGSL